ncbi:hypothetical protein ccbrp13_39450 [Ktedonobacteria bacterium brp13]|nr:hypothetical protein ccbrp13_39450 [Ktedonobacteria bacterium brp13]
MTDQIQSAPTRRGALALVVCAAASGRTIQKFVVLAQADGWDVWVIATPNARSAFIDLPLLEILTGHTVYSEGDALLPAFAAVVVVPATFNTLRKWAQGIKDTLALRLLDSWTLGGLPMLAFPRASAELAQEPDFQHSLARLRALGVTVVYDVERYPPNNDIPWPAVLETLAVLWCNRTDEPAAPDIAFKPGSDAIHP